MELDEAELREAIEELHCVCPQEYEMVLGVLGVNDGDASIEVRTIAALTVLETCHCEIADADVISVIRKAARNITSAGNIDGFKPAQTSVDISEFV